MKIYRIIIKPKSPFITQLKGDTLFGNLCWYINYNSHKFNNSLQDLLKNYKSSPFLVVSSAFYCLKDKDNIYNYIFARPNAPEELLFENNNVDEWIKNRKIRQQKKYFILKENSTISNIKNIYKTSEEVLNGNFSFFKKYDSQHNTINRETFTTGKEKFAPFTLSTFTYNDEINFVVLIAIDETNFSIEQLKDSFDILGRIGFGKKASIGYGKFDVVSCEESKLFKNFSNNSKNSNYFYTLSPCVPKENEIDEKNSYYQPFTRFGKHGDILAKSENPFKKPVIMIDENALLKLNDFNINYPIIGSGIKDVSNIKKETVVQGYTLCLPMIVNN